MSNDLGVDIIKALEEKMNQNEKKYQLKKQKESIRNIINYDKN
jgi:hypothetical protein